MNATGAGSPRAVDFKEVLNAMFEERNERAARVQGRKDDAKAAKAAVNAFIDAATASGNEEDEKCIAAIDRQVLEKLEENRPRIRRWFGRTITLPAGVIKWIIIPPSLQAPKDDKLVVETALKMKNGMRYLIPYFKLNRRAAAAAPPRTQRRLGVTSYSQEQLSFKPVGDNIEPVVLKRRRYPALPHAKD